MRRGGAGRAGAQEENVWRVGIFCEGRQYGVCYSPDELMFRMHEGEADDLLETDGVHTAIMGELVMHDWLQAGGEAIAGEKLQELLTIGYDYALSLPPKK